MSVQGKNTSSFAYVMNPVRESRLLGKRIQFERSTALGFSPDTLLRVMIGRGISGILEESGYKYSLALKALARAEAAGAKMHSATRRDLEEVFGSIEIGGAPLGLDGLRALPNSLGGPWRILRVTMTKDWTRTGRRLFTRLAYYDRIADQIGKVRDPVRITALRQRFFLQSAKFWHECETPLGWEMALCVDATLHHLVWLDRILAAEKPTYEAETLLAISNPKARPMRHWFDRTLCRTRCGDLLDLHQYLLARGAARHGRTISHDLLKKWASSQQLIPHAAAEELLEACSAAAADELERVRLWQAKLMTFLVECVVCFTPEKVKPLVAQRCIFQRIESLQEMFQANQRLCGDNLFVV